MEIDVCRHVDDVGMEPRQSRHAGMGQYHSCVEFVTPHLGVHVNIERGCISGLHKSGPPEGLNSRCTRASAKVDLGSLWSGREWA